MKRSWIILVLLGLSGLFLSHTRASATPDESADEKPGVLRPARLEGFLPVAPPPFTEDELAVIRYIAGRIRMGETAGGVGPAELAASTGLTEQVIRSLVPARLNRGVLAELQKDHPQSAEAQGGEELTGCSLEKNLTGASGEEMAVYHAEKARDGESFDSWRAPDFVLPATTGEEVGLSDLPGRQVALAFVSGHCSHSLEILRRMSALREEFGMEELSIVGIYVNSGSREDVHAWTQYLNIDFPLLVAETSELADRFGFQTVPTVFLLDESRKVRTRLVGEKDREALAGAFRSIARKPLSGGS